MDVTVEGAENSFTNSGENTGKKVTGSGGNGKKNESSCAGNDGSSSGVNDGSSGGVNGGNSGGMNDGSSGGVNDGSSDVADDGSSSGVNDGSSDVANDGNSGVSAKKPDTSEEKMDVTVEGAENSFTNSGVNTGKKVTGSGGNGKKNESSCAGNDGSSSGVNDGSSGGVNGGNSGGMNDGSSGGVNDGSSDVANDGNSGGGGVNEENITGVGGGEAGSGPAASPAVAGSSAPSYSGAVTAGGSSAPLSGDPEDGDLQQRFLDALRRGESSINVEGREVDLSFWIERHGLSAFRDRGAETVWSLPTPGQRSNRRNVARLQWSAQISIPAQMTCPAPQNRYPTTQDPDPTQSAKGDGPGLTPPNRDNSS
ncbi:uncharacterized protein LOC143798575 [Ranitomeya variabilis]|uniref:uncharacterized protein LOC143798575 n=1 Tax=Ranitomeya variabilis TaxID=490064 RepID=UPI0040569D1E